MSELEVGSEISTYSSLCFVSNHPLGISNAYPYSAFEYLESWSSWSITSTVGGGVDVEVCTGVADGDGDETGLGVVVGIIVGVGKLVGSRNTDASILGTTVAVGVTCTAGEGSVV